MHRIEMLRAGLRTLKNHGIQIREEYLGGNRGAFCEIKGQKQVFLDLADSIDDQLALIIETLQQLKSVDLQELPPPLKEYVEGKKFPPNSFFGQQAG
jgi:hypothetical protein